MVGGLIGLKVNETRQPEPAYRLCSAERLNEFQHEAGCMEALLSPQLFMAKPDRSLITL